MTQPITVYPTEFRGQYRTEDGQWGGRLTIASWAQYWCVNCLQLLEVPSSEHWQIGGHDYCKDCVVVADEEEGL